MRTFLRVPTRPAVLLVTGICVALVAGGCGDDADSSSTSSDGAAKSAGTRTDDTAGADALLATWEEAEVAKQSRGSITFNDDGSAQVSDGCNSGATRYTTDGDTIAFKPVAMTMMACIDDTTGESLTSSPLPASLEDAASWSVAGDTLTLADADGTTIATLTKAAPEDAPAETTPPAEG